ncbi:MAG: ribonuclease HII [Woeseiaceae bacterium]|nr:ribonuclease HII [Woeseiaceae bacterium]
MQQENLFQLDGIVAGVDEAGRGPIAGPVVAAAVILDPDQHVAGLDDSKKLTAASREELAVEIRVRSLAWSVAWSDRAEIDSLNILHATMLAMRRAILGLRIQPDAVRVDGNRLPNLRFGSRLISGDAVVGGDALVPAISAASILAKTARDDIMRDMDVLYPNYGFARHKGYGTELHNERLKAHGPCSEHRRSFAPVRAAS